MNSVLSVNNLLDSIIPISRFNRGEANRIFSEVKSSGAKIVVKNNSPECVLISPDEYKQLIEQAENYLLLLEAEHRIKHNNSSGDISHEELMKKYNITEKDLENVEVEFD